MLNFHESATDWKFVKVLGSGAFGEVSSWTNFNIGESVAIKRCFLDQNKLGLDEISKLKERWTQESALVNTINVENIVRGCLHLCPELVAEQNQHTQLPVIPMEYCDGGNLRTMLQKIENANGFNEYEVRQVLGSLGKAVCCLHQINITHRDIKPENVVIKYVNGKSIYKLTDMGYARLLDNKTIAGSMVGSRNYFAPEMIKTAEYKNSVDYWSMGILAFEIICGVFPFYTDQSMFDGLSSVMGKPKGCIAITKSAKGELKHHTKLFPENRLTPPFAELIESWLQIALDQNGRTRGYEAPEPQLQFYSKLETAIASKIVTVGYVNKCLLFSYIVDEQMPLTSLFSAIAKDTGLNMSKVYFVLPAGHALKRLNPGLASIQLYDEHFAVENKPMLYFIDFEQTALCSPAQILIPEGVTSLLNDEIKSKSILERCILHTLHLHRSVQKQVLEFVNGINEFGINMEDEIMEYKKNRKEFNERIIHCNGQANQYERMIAVGKQLLLEKQIPDCEASQNECEMIAENFKSLFLEYDEICAQIELILQQVRDFINKSPISLYLEPVLLQVKKFEDYFKQIQLVDIGAIKEQCVKHVSKLLKLHMEFMQRSKKWLHNPQPTTNSNSNENLSSDFIITVFIQWRTNMKAMAKNYSLWSVCETRMEEKTKEYMETFARRLNCQAVSFIEQDVEDLTQRMEPMDMLGNIDESLDMPINDVISLAYRLMEQLASLHI